MTIDFDTSAEQTITFKIKIIDEGKIIDRRAGRRIEREDVEKISKEIEKEIKKGGNVTFTILFSFLPIKDKTITSYTLAANVAYPSNLVKK